MQNKLFEEHKQWAVHFALKQMKKRKWPIEFFDVIKNSALIGLWEAAQKFVPEKGKSFQTFAYMRIIGSIVDELRTFDWWPSQQRGWKFSGRIIKPPPVTRAGIPSNEEGAKQNVFQMIPCKSVSPDEGLETQDQIKRAYEFIPTRYIGVVKMYFEEEMKMADIAERIGRTESLVCQIIRRAIVEARRSAGTKGVRPTVRYKREVK